jgi:hypothetical protein
VCAGNAGGLGAALHLEGRIPAERKAGISLGLPIVIGSPAESAMRSGRESARTCRSRSERKRVCLRPLNRDIPRAICSYFA